MSYTDEFLKSLGIKWGVYEVAKNLNYFRRSYASETFWNYYREHKDELKAEGISVYKLDGVFYVYDWSRKDKATQEEYDAQEATKKDKIAKHEKEYFDEISMAVIDHSDGNFFPETIEEAEEYIQRNAYNPKALLDEIREHCFNNNINAIVYPVA